MTFLAVIIAYVISISLSGHGEPVTRWAHAWQSFIAKQAFGVKACVAIYALLPALVLGRFVGLGR